MIWPDFCSALIVGRLAPLGLHNTRFRSVPVSRSPRTGADASSSTTRPTGTSPIPARPGRRMACAATPARSRMHRRRIRPWRCRMSRRPCRRAASAKSNAEHRTCPNPNNGSKRLTMYRSIKIQSRSHPWLSLLVR